LLSFKLAIRGLWRHRMRTVVTLLAVALGYVFLLAFMALHTGGHGAMIELGIRQGQAGHVVIQAAGFQQSRATELLVSDPNAVRKVVKRAAPNAHVVPRVFAGGLAQSATDAVGVLFSGVEPTRERRVSEIADSIVDGVYLAASAADVARAEPAPDRLWCAKPREPGSAPIRPIVLGKQLAQTLHVQLCDKVVLTAQGLGDQESAQFRVVGLFSSGNLDLDAFSAQLMLQDAQEILHLDRGVHQIAVFVDSADHAAALVDKLTSATASPSLARFGELDLLTWDKALPELAEFIWLDANSGWVFMIIIFVIIGIGVLNTILMSVMERTRELGVMRALGMRPPHVIRLVMSEGLLIGFLGVLLGAALGLPLVYYLETVGIDLTMWTEEGASLEMGGMTMSVMYGKSSLHQLVSGALAVFGMTLAAAIYPALRAARLHILKAIHHV
jgi:lipoprotein-releasing system permease protein